MLREYPEAEYRSREVSWKLISTIIEDFEMPHALSLCLCLDRIRWVRHICQTQSASRVAVLLI
jgi:hypothetical protein